MTAETIERITKWILNTSLDSDKISDHFHLNKLDREKVRLNTDKLRTIQQNKRR